MPLFIAHTGDFRAQLQKVEFYKCAACSSDTKGSSHIAMVGSTKSWSELGGIFGHRGCENTRVNFAASEPFSNWILLRLLRHHLRPRQPCNAVRGLSFPPPRFPNNFAAFKFVHSSSVVRLNYKQKLLTWAQIYHRHPETSPTLLQVALFISTISTVS